MPADAARRLFGAMLKPLVAKFGGTRALARALDVRNEDSMTGVISNLANGRSAAQLHLVERMADVLGLAGADRTRFVDLAKAGHKYKGSAPLLDELRAELAQARAAAATAEARLAEAEQRAAKAEAALAELRAEVDRLLANRAAKPRKTAG